MKPSSRHLRDTHRYPSYPILPEVIDIDQIDDLADNAGLYIPAVPIKSSHMVLPDEEKHVCGGNLIIFPLGKNQCTLYPFGLHGEQIIPWNYHSIDDKFYLQARSCMKELVDEGEGCIKCKTLKSTSLYDGIEWSTVFIKTHLLHIMELGVWSWLSDGRLIKCSRCV